MQVKLIASAVLLIAVFFAGWKVNGWRYETTISSMKEQAAKQLELATQKNRLLEQQAQDATNKLNTEQTQQQEERNHVKDSIQQAVNQYAATHKTLVVSSSDSCYLDSDWVYLHDSAASGVSPTADAFPSPARAGVTFANALEVITTNYGIANTCEAKLKGWQDWYKIVKKETSPFLEDGNK